MGGTALLVKSGIESQRLTSPEFYRVKNEIHNILDKLGIRWLDVDFIREKEDFGDIDIIVIDDRPLDNIEHNNNTPSYIVYNNLDKFGIDDNLYINNNPFMSILYESKYQVDFITVKPDKALYTQAYLSHNDLGNLLGRCVKRFNITHGMDGLWYDHYLEDRTHRTRFHLSNDPYDILRIHGLDVDKFKDGFDTYTEMFDYVQSSKYFNPELFKFENLNNRNRVRDRKRKIYNQFLDYINYEIVNNNVYNPIDDYPEISEKIAEYNVEFYRRRKIHESIDGRYIMERTGLKNKDLGDLIANIRDTYADDLIGISKEDMDTVIDTTFTKFNEK